MDCFITASIELSSSRTCGVLISMTECSSNYISGWWYTYPSEKYEFVSWDYYSQYIWKVINMFQTFPNHQPAMSLKTILEPKTSTAD